MVRGDRDGDGGVARGRGDGLEVLCWTGRGARSAGRWEVVLGSVCVAIRYIAL